MAEDIKIASIALNNMKLDELTSIDPAKGSDDPSVKNAVNAYEEKNLGLVIPYIKINSFVISNGLKNFNLDLSGFLPVMTFTFIPSDPVFISTAFPKDGDIVSLYIRTPGDYYKPLRMDFKLLTISGGVSSTYSPAKEDPAGNYFKFTVVAECYIPGLYTTRIKSFAEMNSSDVLLDVSQDLNLGFSSNDTTTNDVMTWICPNYSYYDFIQEVASRSYKDDEKSFYDCWIDSYYNLNLVNLGTQFDFKGKVGDTGVYVPGYTRNATRTDAGLPGNPTPSVETAPLVLNNFAGNNIIPFFIKGYTLTSRSGTNSNKTGYITNVGFYDEVSEETDPQNKYVKYDIESITPETVESGTILQKGRARDNNYKEESRINWYGILNSRSESDPSGVHQNFIHAKVQNNINYNDVTKTSLIVELDSYYPGIIRGQVIPVVIYVYESGKRMRNVGDVKNYKENLNTNPVVDKMLSGNYVVIGMEINWTSGDKSISQELILCKRDWTLNSSGAIPKAFPITANKNNV
jgi:hypothetical protein